jgi:hypothetical protein
MELILSWGEKHSEVIIEFQILDAKVVNMNLFKISEDGSDYDVKFKVRETNYTSAYYCYISSLI